MTQHIAFAGRQLLVVLFYANLLSINVHGHHHIELAHVHHAGSRRLFAAVTR